MAQVINGKMNKLLNTPLKAFTLYALLVLAGSIPAYYYIVNRIWLSEIDLHNKFVKRKIETEFSKIVINDTILIQSLSLWNRIEPGIDLRPLAKPVQKSDSLYTVMRANNLHSRHSNRFRGLSSYLIINGKPYHLTVETNVEEADEIISDIAFVTFGFFILLVIGFIVLNQRISAKLWKPFYKTLHQIKAFDLSSQRSIAFEKTTILEFEELNGSLQRLIEKNISSYQEQKEFTENASHELQTPLAIIQSKLDLLLQNEALTGKESEIIEAAHKALARTSRINKNLLLLAKIENQQFVDTEPINLSQLMNDSLDFLSEHIEAKNITIDKQIEQGVFIEGNRILLEILINNLLLNAIRHNVENGKIGVEFSKHRFIVSNTGHNHSLNTANLFKRFSTSSAETPSSGLGLAIVKQICNRYHWQIHYSFDQQLHCFFVAF
ncbi:MAG: HAMP domain-containing histidine kinase [Bacteroidetes bacterium]|nr:HAMP domain-containing histidine kinase [Bacteroidota bacterium]